MEYGPHNEESTLLAAAMGDAAHEAFLESELPPTDEIAAIVANVAATAHESGLVEASRIADRDASLGTVDGILHVVVDAALRTGGLDRGTLHDLIVLRSSDHSQRHYRERRRANAIRRQAQLEVSVRKSTRSDD